MLGAPPPPDLLPELDDELPEEEDELLELDDEELELLLDEEPLDEEELDEPLAPEDDELELLLELMDKVVMLMAEHLSEVLPAASYAKTEYV